MYVCVCCVVMLYVLQVSCGCHAYVMRVPCVVCVSCVVKYIPSKMMSTKGIQKRTNTSSHPTIYFALISSKFPNSISLLFTTKILAKKCKRRVVVYHFHSLSFCLSSFQAERALSLSSPITSPSCEQRFFVVENNISLFFRPNNGLEKKLE